MYIHTHSHCLCPTKTAITEEIRACSPTTASAREQELLLPAMATDGRLPSVAVPGKILGPTTHYVPGPGTHVHNNQVVSSLLGRVSLSAGRAGPTKRLTKITSQSADELPTLSVARGERRREVLPDVGAVVLCRVIRLVTRQAIVSIQQVGDTVLETEWQGVIRSQDVRATEKDKVKIYESFRPGDTVRAQVVSFFNPFPHPYIFFFFLRALMSPDPDSR